MQEVTKEEFRRVYFAHGGGAEAGWGGEYWEKFFAPDRPGMKYWVEMPASPSHCRMMIVTDHGAREYRMFFVTDEEDERMLQFPDDE